MARQIKILTDATIRNAQAGERDLQLSDGEGLVLRVGRGSGDKSFWYRYKQGNSSKWFKLGNYPELSLKEAREKAKKTKEGITAGIDPIAKRQQDAELAGLEIALKKTELAQKEAEAARKIAEAEGVEAARAARLTVQGLFERWASVDLIRRKDGGAEVRRMFEKDVLPLIGAIAVEDVRKGHVTGVADALLARGVPRMAKLIFSLIRQMFRFAVDRDIIEADPTASIRKAKIGGKDVERDRVLSEDEIRQLARQTPSAGLTQTTEAAIWIALSTCCRIVLTQQILHRSCR